MNKPIPKSLHTVTVLVAIARNHMQIHGTSATTAVMCATVMLDLYDSPDTYGLCEQAVRKLSKGV